MSLAPDRYLGVWTLGLIGLNSVIGAGFFVLPAVFYAYVGPLAPWLIAVVGVGLLPIGFCFAEVGSRFRGTGGPYLYIRSAFGPFAGFEASALLWVTRITAHASVLSAMTIVLGTLVPWAADGLGRLGIIGVVTGIVTVVNVAGTKPAAWFLNAVSVFKFVPIVVFVAIGLPQMEWATLEPSAWPRFDAWATAALLVAFALSGFELVGVPAGEARDPQRHVPVALVTVVAVATTVMVLANLVTIGLLGDPTKHDAPMASAAGVLLGQFGIILIVCTAIAAAVGHNMGSLLIASRILYGMAEHGDLPPAFARLDRRYRTPALAIAVSALAIIALAMTNSYATLAILSGLTRLLIFSGVCAATLRLRDTRFAERVPDARYVTPMPRVMPWLGIAAPMLMLGGITVSMLIATVAALLAGAVIYALRHRARRRGAEIPMQ